MEVSGSSPATPTEAQGQCGFVSTADRLVGIPREAHATWHICAVRYSLSLTALSSLAIAAVLAVDSAPWPSSASSAAHAAAACAPVPATGAPDVDIDDAGFVPIAPKRIADTRNGIGVPLEPVDAGCVLSVPLASADVPADAVAVALTVTADRAAEVGYVTAYSCGSARPATSNLNPQPNLPTPNLVIVPIDQTGAVCLFSERSTDLIVDVTGWFVPGADALHAIPPVRALDTRWGARPAKGSMHQVPLAGVHVPESAVAVSVVVTVTQSADSGYVTAYPCGQPEPPTSTNNVLADRDRAAATLVGLGADGSMCLYTDIDAHLIVDVTGWFGPDAVGDSGSPLSRVLATRIADTRSGPGQVAPFAAGEERQYHILDHVPFGTTAVLLQITATSAAAPGYLAVYPCSGAAPDVSSVNFSPGPLSEASLVTIGLSTDGDVCIVASAPTDVVVDLYGSFGPPSLLRSFVTSPALEQTPQLGQIDHAIRCASGGTDVEISVSAGPGTRVAVDGGTPATSVQWSDVLAEDELVPITVTSTSGSVLEQHWVRCLPHDFPELTVEGRSPTPGWYAAAFLPNGVTTTGNFAFILDEFGVPVWYKRLPYPALGVWTNGSDEVAWRRWTGGGFPTEGPPYGGMELHDLDGSRVDTIHIPDGPEAGNVGWHELLTLPNGNRLVTQYVARTDMGNHTCFNAMNPSEIINGANKVIDGHLVELDPNGNEVWRWRSNDPDHIDVSETAIPLCVNRVPTAPPSDPNWELDLVHINAVDVFPNGDYLVSMRHTNAIYRIARLTGDVVWKLGGAHVPGRSLSIIGDALGGPNAAHDARVLPDGHVTLHDNRSFATSDKRPRAVEYEIDGTTATLVWSFASPNPLSPAQGSVRRQPDGSTVIGWGSVGSPWLQEIDAAGNTLMEISVPASHTFYRVVKLPASTYDRDTLRSSAGGTAEAAS